MSYTVSHNPKTFMHWIIALLLFTSACSSKGPDDFLARGRAIKRELLEELQNIDDLDALIHALPHLQALFDQLVDVMIDARKWQIKHKTSWKPYDEDHKLCLELANALARVYAIPTAQPLIERCQEKALVRLDSFEKKHNRSP